MNCRSCGANLPPGSAFCTLCGAPTPYNTQPSGSGSSPQFDPTVAAPQYGAPNNPPQFDPTVMASPPPYGAPDAPPPPSTAYGAPAYGAPSYDAPPPPTPSYQANQYSAGAPPVGGYGQPGTYGAFQQPPKPRSRLGLILGIIGGVLLLLCIGTCAVLYQVGKSSAPAINSLATTTSATETAAIATVTAASGTITTASTPITGSGQTTAPSGQPIDPTAASIITNPQAASAIDENTAKPTRLATTFKVGATMYVTFDLNLRGKTGYTRAKWYAGNSLVHNGKILSIDDPDYVHVYLSWSYDSPGQGIAEVYWCSQSDCSDGKLAQVISFTISSTSMHLIGQPVVTSMDINRPE
jgi:hypothetical protein